MMKRMLLLCAVALLATVAGATTITAGGSTAASDFCPSGPCLFGTVVADTGKISFTGKDALGNTTYTGQVEQIVFADNGGTLDFIWQFTGLTGDAITQMSATNFAGFTTDVGYDSTQFIAGWSLGSVAPTTITRSSGGNVLDFNFSGVGSGATTFALVVKTNGTSWVQGNTGFLDGGTANVITYAPSVPEPATFTFLASGLVMFGIRRFRK